jgi:hypothetical protein
VGPIAPPVILSAEDGHKDTIRPRLATAGRRRGTALHDGRGERRRRRVTAAGSAARPASPRRGRGAAWRQLARHEEGRRDPPKHPRRTPEPTADGQQGLGLDRGYAYDEVQEIAEEFHNTTCLPSDRGEAQKVKQQAGHEGRRELFSRLRSTFAQGISPNSPDHRFV